MRLLEEMEFITDLFTKLWIFYVGLQQYTNIRENIIISVQPKLKVS